ncbi:MAG: hypothetical protein HC935_02810 [Pseudanabaena sp. SU_2_4]|nr:hypothetical protein [Pseudanabaena sp. SU_2_4]
MSSTNDAMQLMYLWTHEISVSEPTNTPQFLVDAAADTLTKNGGKNWIPVVVKEIGKGQYKVIANTFIYAAAEAAGLEKIWCIVADESEDIDYVAKVLAGETIPKLNLSTASYEQIKTALEYATEQANSALKGIKELVVATRISEAPRQTWKNLDEIIKLKCGITKGKKLDALAKVFFLSEPVLPPPPPEIISVKKATRDEIFERLSYLSTYKVGGFEEVDLDASADAILTAVKDKWKTLNPIAKLECGIDTPKIKTLKTVFSL